MTMPALDARWWHSFKSIDGVSVTLLDLSPYVEREDSALQWLDRQERLRWQRYEFAGPRRRFLLCRAALRAMLCTRLACDNEHLDFETSHHGKPFARVAGIPAPISFNVSHSGERGLIAISRSGRLGVDIEERNFHRDVDYLIDAVSGEKEKAEISSRQALSRLLLFYKLWTLKEAILKAYGKGFHIDPTSIEIPLPMLRGEAKSKMQLPHAPGVTWHVTDIGNADFAAALAYELTGAPVEKD